LRADSLTDLHVSVGAEEDMPGNLQPEDRTAWLLLIGRRLRAEYDVVAEPVPPRLAALIEQLETSAQDAGQSDAGQPDGSQQDGASARPCRAGRA
jgi:Anti-sigma factor NepR